MNVKRIILIGVLIIFALCAVGCTPAEVSEEQIRQDIISSAPNWDDDVQIADFSISSRNYFEESKTATVHVSLNGASDVLASIREYVLHYFYTGKDGWQLSDIELESAEDKPLSGPSTELIKKTLIGKSVYVLFNDKYDITEETLVDLQVIEDRMEVVDNSFASRGWYTLVLENEFVRVQGTVETACRFEEDLLWEKKSSAISRDGWRVYETELLDDFTSEFKHGEGPLAYMTEEEKKETALIWLAEIEKFPLAEEYGWGDAVQYVWLQAENIKELEVHAPIPGTGGKVSLTRIDFQYVTDLATFSVSCTARHDYDEETGYLPYSGIWCDSVSVDIDWKEFPQKWIYRDPSGGWEYELVFSEITSEGQLEAILYYSPQPGKTGESGSYPITGSVNFSTLEIELTGKDFRLVDGVIHPDNSCIMDEDYNIIFFPKDNYSRITSTPGVYDEMNFLTDVQRKELQTAIEYIYNKHNVGVYLLTTSAPALKTWQYYGWFYGKLHEEKDYILCSINVGNDGAIHEYGYIGARLDEATVSGKIASGFKKGQWNRAEYAKGFRLFVQEINRFLGGADDDFQFSW